MGNIRLYLRANERVFINGAVFRVDRKVSIELLNDTTFLLENHVMQKEEANTPVKQLYFIVQLLLMDPINTESPKKLFRKMVSDILDNLENKELMEGIKEVDVEVSTGKVFSALKMIRGLFPLEQMTTTPETKVPDNVVIAEKMVALEKRNVGKC